MQRIHVASVLFQILKQAVKRRASVRYAKQQGWLSLGSFEMIMV